MLRLVQGHPKLIDLAEAQAKDPSLLAEHLARADAAQTKGAAELDAFFQDGATCFDQAAFLTSLRDWTNGIVGALPGVRHGSSSTFCARSKAPEQDTDIALALRNFALAMERDLPDFKMVHVVARRMIGRVGSSR